MDKQNYIQCLALLAVLCGLAACSKPPTETSAAVPSAPTPSSAAPEPVAAADGAIKPGKYRVCSVEGVLEHGDVLGEHIKDQDEIEIQPINANGTTLVCIGGSCPPDPMNPVFDDKVLWMTGDSRRLSTVEEFKHHTEANAASSERHLVKLSEDPSPPDACKGQHVVLLEFCHWTAPAGERPQWLCAPSQGPHGGAAHAED